MTMSYTNNSQEPGHKFVVLYIEDDIANRQLVQFIFSRRDDLQLIEAETGSSGIQLAIQQHPGLILLDLNLPDLDGYEILKQLQSVSSTSHIPVIAVSGSSSPADISKGMNAGLQGYLTKPIQVVELYALIDKFIALKD